MGKVIRHLQASIDAERSRARRPRRGAHSMLFATSSYLLELGKFVLQHLPADVDGTSLLDAHRDFEEAVKEFLR